MKILRPRLSESPDANLRIDANILIVLADVNHIHYSVTDKAVTSLLASGALLRTLPQSLFEFWVVATRPAKLNGLGLSVTDAESELLSLTASFPIMPDDPAYVTYWRRIMVKYAVTGKPSHDARYVASMQAHGLTHLLTLDAGFNRYAPEGIIVIDPASVPAPP